METGRVFFSGGGRKFRSFWADQSAVKAVFHFDKKQIPFLKGKKFYVNLGIRRFFPIICACFQGVIQCISNDDSDVVIGDMKRIREEQRVSLQMKAGDLKDCFVIFHIQQGIRDGVSGVKTVFQLL